jgi:hypothetical protein
LIKIEFKHEWRDLIKRKTAIKTLQVECTLILLISLHLTMVCCAQDTRIHPKDLKYLGAFQLPEGSNGTDWSYSGNALTYFPKGDLQGKKDGFPGSLFATGNDTHLFVSEISIPAPKISKNKRVGELNTAHTLQPFTNVFKGVIDYLEQPRVGLCYLPSKLKSGKGRIHFSLGLHLQDTGFDPSHGSFKTDLSNLQHTGLFTFDNYSGYVTNDYMCKIPKAFADANTKGQRLATGRGREGPWAGGGPALFAYSPSKKGSFAITPLLLYGKQIPGVPEISSSKKQQMPDYSDSDRFRGCAWLSKGNNSTVVFTSTKAMGKSWYGFANGVRWDYQCGQSGHPSCPDVPKFPYTDRGFWAEDLQAQLIFYDSEDLAAVARGHEKSWTPKPYAVMDLSPFFFDPKYSKQDLINYKRDFVGAICFDDHHGILYIMEPLAEEDGRSIIHVFKVK